MQNKDLRKRILDISYEKGLSHLGSCLTSVNIIDEIYQQKKVEEKFILSSGHAGLALYCVIEKYEGIDAEKIFAHHGVHPDRCEECHLDCSTGSLGQGLPIAVGMALADRTKNVYCLISDGECSEGSIWEAIRIMGEQNLINLKLWVNVNGWGAYKKIERAKLEHELMRQVPSVPNVYWTDSEQFPFLKGQDAHYHVMSEEEYKDALTYL